MASSFSAKVDDESTRGGNTSTRMYLKYFCLFLLDNERGLTGGRC